MSAPAVEAVDLYRFFHAGDDETLALRGVSLTAQPGEMVAVVGPSGSGKSTLLACLAGLDEPDGGTVSIGGERMSRRPEPERASLRARRVGLVSQTGNLIAHLSVDANLRLAQRLAGRVGRADGARRRRELLDRLGLLERRDAVPARLSGGERVRAAVAVAVVNRPAVVLADEPTGELDASGAANVVELLGGLAGEGAAVVLATHSPAAAGSAGRVLRLRDGREAGA
jgi:putative ABC transport system ATP-binding protein